MIYLLGTSRREVHAAARDDGHLNFSLANCGSFLASDFMRVPMENWISVERYGATYTQAEETMYARVHDQLQWNDGPQGPPRLVKFACAPRRKGSRLYIWGKTDGPRAPQENSRTSDKRGAPTTALSVIMRETWTSRPRGDRPLGTLSSRGRLPGKPGTSLRGRRSASDGIEQCLWYVAVHQRGLEPGGGTTWASEGICTGEETEGTREEKGEERRGRHVRSLRARDALDINPKIPGLKKERVEAMLIICGPRPGYSWDELGLELLAARLLHGHQSPSYKREDGRNEGRNKRWAAMRGTTVLEAENTFALGYMTDAASGMV
ncbi:hypothetical protein C8R47DRAFT_1083406 [Mycena vitilis]|nr:hypothetical protein C8R47DRAFT_1083406 [Mycena vitilis]